MVLGLALIFCVRDGGVPAWLSAWLAGDLVQVEVTGDHYICIVGAPCRIVAVGQRLLGEAGIAGFSFYRGIPGWLAVDLRMNAGPWRRTKDILVQHMRLDRKGNQHVLSNAIGYVIAFVLHPKLYFYQSIMRAAEIRLICCGNWMSLLVIVKRFSRSRTQRWLHLKKPARSFLHFGRLDEAGFRCTRLAARNV